MKTWYIILTVLFLTGCGTQQKTTEMNQELSFKTIAQSSLYGNGKEKIQKGIYTIKSLTEWNNLLEKMNKVNNEKEKMIPLEIDFDKSMVIAVFDNVLGSGGVKVQINKIEETPEQIIVYAGHSTPMGFATMVMNQPYHLVLTQKSDKPVKLSGLKL